MHCNLVGVQRSLKLNYLRKIANYCNVTNVLAVNSWTTGAELLLYYWCDIKEGYEVF